MTEEEINIAIAEHLGAYQAGFCWFHQNGARVTLSDPLRNYARDLNAMREALGSLTFSQGIEYGKILHQVLDVSTESPDFDWQAEARFVAEAFLRTVGKWKEEA
jgi:hypothetical protein